MSAATMTVKKTTRNNKPISEYSIKVYYIKPVMKGNILATEWTLRGDTYLAKFKDRNMPFVEQLEALIFQLIEENDNCWKVTIYNNLLPYPQNILYHRQHDVISKPGEHLSGYYIKQLKKYGLL